MGNEQMEGNMPHITIKPEHALFDQPIVIKLEGVEPGSAVTMRLHFADDRHQIWQSAADFLADPTGALDLQTAKPVHGDYQEPDPMGLFWSLHLADGNTASAFPFLFSATLSLTPLPFTMVAEVNGTVVATVSLVRQFYANSVERVEIVQPGLVATFFRPRREGLYPAAITVGGSGGSFGWARQMAALLASHGRAALAVAYFDWAGADGLPTALVEIPLETIQAAINYLRTAPGVTLADMALLGFSKGAEMTLLAATLYPEIQQVVAYMPSSVIWEGIRQPPGTPHSSWSYQGQPLPFIPNAQQGNYYPNMVAAIERLQQVKPTPGARWTQAIIPVEKIAGPVLLISSAADSVWPSAAMANLIMARLHRSQHPFQHKHLCLAKAGHGVGIPFLPYAAINPEDVAAIAQETTLAWQEVITFLHGERGVEHDHR